MAVLAALRMAVLPGVAEGPTAAHIRAALAERSVLEPVKVIRDVITGMPLDALLQLNATYDPSSSSSSSSSSFSSSSSSLSGQSSVAVPQEVRQLLKKMQQMETKSAAQLQQMESNSKAQLQQMQQQMETKSAAQLQQMDQMMEMMQRLLSEKKNSGGAGFGAPSGEITDGEYDEAVTFHDGGGGGGGEATAAAARYRADQAEALLDAQDACKETLERRIEALQEMRNAAADAADPLVKAELLVRCRREHASLRAAAKATKNASEKLNVSVYTESSN